MKKLIRNAAQCLDCGDIVESKYRHEFVSCSCYCSLKRTGVFVDGGTEYSRNGAYTLEKFKDLCEWEGEDDPAPELLPGIVKSMGDEWMHVDDALPKTGELVLVYDPSDANTPYVVAIYDERMKMWTCAHCKRSYIHPKLWKFMEQQE